MDTEKSNPNSCVSVFIRGLKNSLRFKKRQPSHLKTGEWGERVAEKHLKKKQYRIIGRRVRVGRRDELDLLAQSPDGALVFVEVKTRGSQEFGRPFSAVNRRKRETLSRAAWAYMKKLRQKPNYFRFDVVEVIGSAETADAEVRHIENAFALSGRRRINW